MPEAYPWSSYLDYIGERKSPEWLKTSFILGFFGNDHGAGTNYQRFVEDLSDREYDSPLKGATAEAILGGEEFVSEITAQHVAGKLSDRDVPAIIKLSTSPTLDGITEAIESLGHERISKKAGIYLCHKYSGTKLKEIGERFGIGVSAVSQASRRFMVEMESDLELRTLVDKIGAKLGLSNV